jgi:plasmid stability protein
MSSTEQNDNVRRSRLVYISEVPDWSIRADHIENRSRRKGESEPDNMTEQIAKVLKEASEDAESHRDATPRTGIRPQRRNGAGCPAVLSVRLTGAQYQLLTSRAQRNGKPVSAEARDILLAALDAGEQDVLGQKLEQVLRRTLAPEVLKGQA